MNASQAPHVARGLSASSESRQIMADWLRITRAPKQRQVDYKALLTQRYPCGLLNDAELEALLGVIYN